VRPASLWSACTAGRSTISVAWASCGLAQSLLLG
jgi:hypothetical protein